MKPMKYSLLLILTICCLNAHAQWDDYYVPSNKPDALKEDLKGPVKYAKVTEWKLKLKFGKPEKEAFEFQREYDFDKKQMLLKRTSTSERMKYLGFSKNIYFYNNAGQLTKIDYVDDGKTGTGYKFTYDEKGRLKDKDIPDGDKISKKCRYR
jgi:YD repeat-containing protein